MRFCAIITEVRINAFLEKEQTPFAHTRFRTARKLHLTRSHVFGFSVTKATENLLNV